MKMFIDGSTIGESYKQMKVYFSEQIDLLANAGQALLAAYLVQNRDSLILHGDGNLTISQFDLPSATT